jgi:hypothetical protein
MPIVGLLVGAGVGLWLDRGFDASDALATPIDTKRWLLWGSLVLAAAVLGWMAWTLSKQMRPAAPADAARDAPPETRELL